MVWFWVVVLDNLKDVPDSIGQICSPINVKLTTTPVTYPEQIQMNSPAANQSPIDLLSSAMSAASGWLRAITVDRLDNGVSVVIPSPIFDTRDAAQAWFDSTSPVLQMLQSYKNAVLFQVEPK